MWCLLMAWFLQIYNSVTKSELLHSIAAVQQSKIETASDETIAIETDSDTRKNASVTEKRTMEIFHRDCLLNLHLFCLLRLIQSYPI